MSNTIDQYGFSKLLYAQYWQKNILKQDELINSGSDYDEQIKMYLKSTSSIRVEILKLYNKYIEFDINYFIQKGYLKYINSTYTFDYSRLKDETIDKYLECRHIDSQIVEFINKNVKLSNNQKIKYSNNVDFSNLDINFDVSLLINRIILSRVQNEIDTLSHNENNNYIDKLKDFNTPLTYMEAKQGIDEDDRLLQIEEFQKNPKRIIKFKKLLKRMQENIPSKSEFILITTRNRTNEIINLMDGGAKVEIDSFNIAIKNENIEIVKLFLDRKQIENIVDEADEFGKFSLHIAIATQNVQLIKTLMDYEFEVNVTDDNNYDTFYYLCRTNNFEMVKFLVNCGLKTSVENFVNSIMLCKNLNIVDYLLKNSNNLINEYIVWNEFILRYSNQDEFKTKISFAIKENNIDMIGKLFVPNMKDEQKNLEVAAKTGNVEAFEWILAHENHIFSINSKVLKCIFEHKSFIILDFLMIKNITSYEDILIASLFNKNAQSTMNHVLELQGAPYNNISIDILKTKLISYFFKKTQNVNIAQENINFLNDFLKNLLSLNMEIMNTIAEYNNDLFYPSEKENFTQLSRDIDDIKLFLKIMNVGEDNNLQIIKKILYKNNNLNFFQDKIEFVNIILDVENLELVNILISNNEKFIKQKNKGNIALMEKKYTLIDTFIKEFELNKVDANMEVAFERTKNICDVFKKYFPEESEKIEDFITKIEYNRNHIIDINEDEIPF